MRHDIATVLRWVADRVDDLGAFIDKWHVQIALGLDWVADRLEGKDGND